MRVILTVMLGVLLSAGPAMAKDDGGFGSHRFSAQTPAALGGEAPADMIAVSPSAIPPSDIEPAAGEEDITPAEEPINGDVLHNSEHEIETIIIQKDLNIR